MPVAFDGFLHAARAARSHLFSRSTPIIAARAPGWIDFLGGAAAGGCLALGRPLADSSFAALQPTSEAILTVQVEGQEVRSLPLGELRDRDGWPYAYAEVAPRIADQPVEVQLAATVWLALLREEFMRPPAGARLLLRPTQGPGGNVSLLTAIAQALVTAFEVRLPARELALACRIAATQILAAPLNALGPMTCVGAPAGELLMLHQQPAWHWGNLHLPPGTAIWALQVGDGSKPIAAEARTAAHMAYRMLVEAADMSENEAAARWNGYLSRIDSATFRRRYHGLLPEHLSGAAFLARYTDTDLDVNPHAQYSIRAAGALPIEEHLRTRTIVALLRAAASKSQRDDDLRLIGEYLFQSHWAQSDAGIADRHADALVEQIEAAGFDSGLYGARLPAAECGATLVVLGRSDAEAVLAQIGLTYARTSGSAVVLYGGSAPGCNPAARAQLSDTIYEEI
ncbi:MAG: hypothetical protein HC822_04340 [Oscillochloris sp.]|nr:hypothetical protein [Oscillochloris sp.]